MAWTTAINRGRAATSTAGPQQEFRPVVWRGMGTIKRIPETGGESLGARLAGKASSLFKTRAVAGKDL
jgi:hypothetical protein